jgi:hypothetical protein
LRLAQVELCRRQRRLGGTQLRVVRTGRTQRLLGAAETGLGRSNRRLARRHGRDRPVALYRRRYAARRQLQGAFGRSTAVSQHRLGLGDLGLRSGNVCG